MAEIYPVTPDQVSNDLETAMTEFDEARKQAKDAIEAFEVRHGMEAAHAAQATIEKPGAGIHALAGYCGIAECGREAVSRRRR